MNRAMAEKNGVAWPCPCKPFQQARAAPAESSGTGSRYSTASSFQLQPHDGVYHDEMIRLRAGLSRPFVIS